MRLSAHIAQVNVSGVVTQIGRIAELLGMLFVVPAVAAGVLGEWTEAAIFAALAAALGGGGWLGARRGDDDIGYTDGLVITALAYLIASLAGAVAFLPVVDLDDAFFEAMSGFTTTGLTVVPLDGLPGSLVLFRAFSQWIGGAGIVVLVLTVLLRTSRAAHRLYVSEADEQQLVGSVRATARTVARVYLMLTGAAILLLLAAGMTPFDALVHGLAAISTGGFSPHADSIGHYPGTAVHLVVLLLMLAGATSFPLFSRVRSDGPRALLADPQLRALLTGCVVGGALIWLATPADGPIDSLFHAATALTTTGYSVSDPSGWAPETRSLAILMMVVGGSAGSTAGGIKLIRLIALLKLGGWLIARTLLPEEAKLPLRLGGVATSETDLLRTTALVVFYLVILALSAVALAFTGAGLERSLFEAASALGTVGLSVGIASPDLPLWAKLVLIFDMWVGRLEIVPVMVLLYPGVWRRI